MNPTNDHLHSADDALYRADECEGYGPVRSQLIATAAGEIAAAGYAGLAETAWDLRYRGSPDRLRAQIRSILRLNVVMRPGELGDEHRVNRGGGGLK